MHRLLRVPVGQRANAKELFKVLSEPGTADGMFDVGFSPNGTPAVTHYISSGLIEPQIDAVLGNAAATFALYQSRGGVLLTLGNIQALYAIMDMRTDAKGYEQIVLGLLGMKPVQGP